MVHPETAEIDTAADRHARRREALRRGVGHGVILIPSNTPSWRGADNLYPFRQNSNLLYLAPISRPGVLLVLDVEEGKDILFAPAEDSDDLVWHGPRTPVRDEAAAFGIEDVRDGSDLPRFLDDVRASGRKLQLPPIFQPGVREEIAAWLGIAPEGLEARVSPELVRALGELRLRKDAHEVEEIERALTTTAEMFGAAMRAARPGVPEAGIVGEMARVAFAANMPFSFNPIVTVRGEVLHMETYANVLAEGDLLLLDAGLESPAGYASDITRTIPVSGTFSDRQRAVYEVVLAAQLAAIAEMVPGASFRAVHDRASRVVAKGLIDLGLMRGDAAEVVAAGAHALFFAHGLGHPLGLDVHDVHDLGDDVSYPADQGRSEQFGTRFLRFARTLDEGMVMTVEPGIYFIPALIDRWRREQRHATFIDYDAVEEYRSFGGVRIEDDVLVEATGARVLGPAIPKLPSDVQDAMCG
jgi:Xaa-Pro aminopeptidase